MKTFVILSSVVVCFSLLLLFVIGKYSQKGHAPGRVNAGLSKCPTKPNCVCSEYIDDIDHYIHPIKNSHKADIIDISKVSVIIEEMGGEIHDESDQYIAATFTSRIFGFTDDFEIRVDQAHKVIHFRSASRVGYNDAGVNRKRVELFKKLFTQ